LIQNPHQTRYGRLHSKANSPGSNPHAPSLVYATEHTVECLITMVNDEIEAIEIFLF